jgi:hypothetical protein
MSDRLLTEIRSFLAESGMGPSYFGRLAVGNSELVNRLEQGKTITLVTAERIREFIAERRASVEENKVA